MGRAGGDVWEARVVVRIEGSWRPEGVATGREGGAYGFKVRVGAGWEVGRRGDVMEARMASR